MADETERFNNIIFIHEENFLGLSATLTQKEKYADLYIILLASQPGRRSSVWIDRFRPIKH